MRNIQKIYMNKSWRQRELMFIGTIFILMVLVLTTLLMSIKKIQKVTDFEDSNKINREKVVTTIYVEKNSTLWDIATKYYTEEYESLSNMIEEIKRSNGMEGDTIHEGAYLIVPYYINNGITSGVSSYTP